VLLLVAGARKLADPVPTAQALRAARLSDRYVLVRALGAGEVAVSLLVFAQGGRFAAGLLAIAYLAFAAFLLRLRGIAGSGADCGCLGARPAPVTGLHVAIDLAFAAWASVAVLLPVEPAARVLAVQPWGGLPAVALVLLAALLTRLLFTALPDLVAATRGVPAPGDSR
jgi:hypothetical protein